MNGFSKAKAVWGENLKNQWNQFVGFFSEIEVPVKQTITIKIAARSYYRLYVNGEMKANGPARSAQGYCRIDRISLEAEDSMKIAVEVTALNKPEKYCNDCTLEPGMLALEIENEKGEIISYTGDQTWKYKELLYRRSLVETMSHSRGIVEWYDLDTNSYDWLMGNSELESPILVEEDIHYLERHAGYASYQPVSMDTLENISDVKSGEGDSGFVLFLAKYFNPKYYEMIPEENHFLENLRKEEEAFFTGKYELDRKNGRKIIHITPGKAPAAVTFGRDKTELGFLKLDVTVSEECCMDVINADHLHFTGEFKSNTYAARYCLKPGKYHLITFEPKLTRYVKVIFRTTGNVSMEYPELLDYSYNDEKEGFFSCSDGDLNAIYEAARRTLRLSTLDIFMDCPQRERGGWLCDSLFSARGAWQMFGDLRVEHDFIENFMLTDGKQKWHGFFPEVYPGCKSSEDAVGITTWSFWLLEEVYEYYQRSGDREFIDACQERIRCFVNGMLDLRGKSGLLEGMKDQFVDWSLSNQSFCLEPINIPTNCLAVNALEKMAELYDQPEWKKAAEKMRFIIEHIEPGIPGYGGNGDCAVYENNKVQRGNCLTESGAAYEIWAGFHGNDKKYLNSFVNTMGYSPKYRSNPNYGKSNLFIGLIVRFDILARLGKTETLVKELKDVYLDELRDGSGTFFENYNAFSGCHGMNGVAGVWLTNKVLGLGEPLELYKTVKISPNPCGLRWAQGAAKCSDGYIFMKYKADQEEHVLDISLQIPEGWKYKLELPFELSGWKILLNGTDIK